MTKETIVLTCPVGWPEECQLCLQKCNSVDPLIPQDVLKLVDCWEQLRCHGICQGGGQLLTCAPSPFWWAAASYYVGRIASPSPVCAFSLWSLCYENIPFCWVENLKFRPSLDQCLSNRNIMHAIIWTT